MADATTSRQYRGARARNRGQYYVAEIRKPYKLFPTWLGFYKSPIAAARAYDTAQFYLRGPSARFNFPEEIVADQLTREFGLSMAEIWRKAMEVGGRVDWMELQALVDAMVVATREDAIHAELLALDERIGNVSSGLSEEAVAKRLKQYNYSSPNRHISMEEELCCICQEEYVEGDELGRLDCGHDFHSSCIKQWLIRKNLCPICKNTAL